MLPVAVAQSSSDNNAVSYVLLVCGLDDSSFDMMDQIEIQAWSLRCSKLSIVTHQVAQLNCAHEVKSALLCVLFVSCYHQWLVFTARRSNASAVLGVVILSVCPSVCPSVCHTRALWLIQRTYRQYFYTTWKRNPSSFLPPNSGWWAMSPSTFNGRSKWPTPLQKSITSTDFQL